MEDSKIDSEEKLNNNKRFLCYLRKIQELLTRNYILLIAPVSVLVLKLLGISETNLFFRDYLNLEEKEPKDFFMLILGSIASLFGILIAFVILSVEHSKERIIKNSHVNILNNPKLRNYIQFSVSLLIGCFIAYFTINDFHSGINLTLGYLIGLLFIAFLSWLYPFVTELIKNSSRIGHNLENAKSLRFEAFANNSRYINIFSNNIKEDNALSDLRKEIDNYILKDDVQSYQAIYNQIIQNACNEIGDGSERNRTSLVIDSVLTLWKCNAKTAIRVNDSNFFDLFWEVIVKKIYFYFAEEKIELLYSQDISFFLHLNMPSFYDRLGNGISLDVATDSLEQSLYKNLNENLVEAEDSSATTEFQGDFDGGLHWDYIVHIYDDIVRLKDIALLLKDKVAFQSINDRIETITINILNEFDDLSRNQKSELIWKAQLHSVWISEKSIEEGLYENSLEPFESTEHFIKRIVEGQLLETKTIRLLITSLGNVYKKLLLKKKLFTDYEYGTLRDFKSIGLRSVKRYDENQLDKSVVDYFHCYFLDLEKLMTEKGIEHFQKEYSDLKAHVDHFVRVINHDKPDTPLLVEWINLQSSFTLIENETVSNSCWKIE